MYYIVYKVTNQINGKIYIGTHKTKDLNDGYMGSGKYLKHSQAKHGIENFSKEILFVYDEPEPMYAKEAELVNEDFLAEENTYNIKKGGNGGFDYLNSDKCLNSTHTTEHIAYLNTCRKKKYPKGTFYGKNHTNESKRKIGLVQAGNKHFLGNKHSEETKQRIGKANSNHQKGEGNSQYGTRWIHSLELKSSKRIKKDEELPEGWAEGRKINFK